MRIVLIALVVALALAAFWVPLDKYSSAALIGASYLCFCLIFLRRPNAQPQAELWIGYASQSGHAEQLARQSAQALQQAGINAHAVNLNQLPNAAFRGTLLLIASTYGEGEAPDNGARFLKRLRRADASALNYAVLGLGDRHYAQFCAFGLALDQALADAGAQRLFAPLCMDHSEPSVWAQWQAQLATLSPQALHWQHTAYSSVRLSKRTCLNPDSRADKVYHLVFDAPPSAWQAGDLVDVLPCNDPTLGARTYSIASASGALELIVRQMFTPQGELGLGSGWLSEGLKVGEQALISLRPHPAFHAPEAHTPMILIGAGTGIAGLRAHLQARPHGTQNWLVFGERSQATDFLLQDELSAWHAEGRLTQLDVAFSRDGAQKCYVQHVLVNKQDRLRDWLNQGAAIYVCGSLNGMGHAVDQTLRELLGDHALLALSEQGRYRRDLY